MSLMNARLTAFLGSSTAEHPAVNRRVVGSNPTRGAMNFQAIFDGFYYALDPPAGALLPALPASVVASGIPTSLAAAKTSVVVTRLVSPSPTAVKTSDFATPKAAPLSFLMSLPLFQGPSGKNDVVTIRLEEFCQIRRFYHADQPLFRPKRGSLSHGWCREGYLGAPRAPAQW